MLLDGIKLEYIVPAILFIAGCLAGSLAMYTSHETECAQELIDLAKLRVEITELQNKLAICTANQTGKMVIDCKQVCAKQVKKALADSQAWACGD